MKFLFKLTTIAALLIVLIVLVVLFVASSDIYSGETASVKFVNSSEQLVTFASITVAGKSCSVTELAVGGAFSCKFENLHDSSYLVSVELQDGSTYQESLGYVTGGFDFNDTIAINQVGVIELVEGSID